MHTIFYVLATVAAAFVVWVCLRSFGLLGVLASVIPCGFVAIGGHASASFVFNRRHYSKYVRLVIDRDGKVKDVVP